MSSWNFQKLDMFILLLILNLSPLFLCESGKEGRRERKGKRKADDGDDSDGEGDDGEGGYIIKQNHPRHCR